MDFSTRFPSARRARPAALIATRSGFASRLRWLSRIQGGAGRASTGEGTIVRCRWNERLHGFSLALQCG
ncbi:MAG: hypothetical protein RL654_2788 [Pseudomonadota bacterium]|jgi:hypothetical protein